jgi:hypothetical protein
MNSIRLSRPQLHEVLMAFGTFQRYRTPYGVVRACAAHDDFEIVGEDGVVKGEKGDFICIAEDTYGCWTESEESFQRLHTLIEEKP